MGKSTRRQSSAGWSFIAGEKGVNRVRVYERGDCSGIWLDYRDQDSERHRHPLQNHTRESAKAKAEEIAAKFRRAGGAPPPELTLAALFDIYEREVTPTKSVGEQKHDRRTFPLFLKAFGANRRPSTLSVREWNAYMKDRRSGRIKPPNSHESCVRARVVEHDLKLLNAVLNWATRAGDGRGGYLLERNPAKGLTIPKEESPKRALMTEAQYAAVRKAAAAESSWAEAFVVLAWHTGHRAASIRQLQWEDVDLGTRRIHWRANADKMALDHWNPLHPEAVAMLKRQQALLEVLGEGDCSPWIFPAAHDPKKAVGRDTMNKLWARIAAKTRIPSQERFGWHSLRRAFANRHRNAPLRELQDLGGWKTHHTLLSVYLRPDEEAQRKVLEGRPQ